MLHSNPGRPAFAHYDVDLVSAELPCGAAWLANCLLELDVSLWKPWGVDDSAHWEHLGVREYRYTLHGSPWSRVLPALVENRRFAFRSEPVVRAHHFWPGILPATERTILFVRDPRDALLSAWHRMHRLGAIGPNVDFASFIESRYFHYPMSWSDYLLIFLRVWRAWLALHGGLVVRFEDYRGNASATLESALRHLGIEDSHERVQHAVDASSLQRVQAAERHLLAQGIVDKGLLRGNPPGEYAQAFDAAMHDAVGADYEDILVWLGYAAPMTINPRGISRRRLDASQILEAMRHAGADFGRNPWLESALAEAIAA